MWHQYFDHHSLLRLPILSMLLFAGAFVGIVLRAALQNKDDAARLSALPLLTDGTDAPDAAAEEKTP